MVFKNTYIHNSFLESHRQLSEQFSVLLSQRRREIFKRIRERPHKSREDKPWEIRSYPVLAVLAPVMNTHEDKIEFPGDPMCLYAALSVSVAETLKARKSNFNPNDPYNDLCPRWGKRPSINYRQHVSENGIRDYSDWDLNTDQTIFDPRVWNPEVKDYFIKYILRVILPKVVLISTVSPGHRYAIDIAQTIRNELPGTLIVFGGRHIDETIRYNYVTRQLDFEYSSTIRAIDDGRCPQIVDFLISGDGYFALDILMKAISIAMDLDAKVASVRDIVNTLKEIAPMFKDIAGNAVITAIEEEGIYAFPIAGAKIDLGKLPSPYYAFASRARFPIFTDELGAVQRTYHMMVTDGCPYHCNFCSEGVTVIGQLQKFTDKPINYAMDRLYEYLSYGAEAIFFDDSVFWGGNIKNMLDFCEALATARTEASERLNDHRLSTKERSLLERLRNLQWGAQLTIEFIVFFNRHHKAITLLHQMKRAGCTYIYIGLESLSSQVMSSIQKNVSQRNGKTWADKIYLGLQMLKDAEIRVGTSVLFGLDGETQESIEETILGVQRLIEDDLIFVASPNILTYHPGTEITYLHQKADSLDYHSLEFENRPPYTYFEEAFPQVVSNRLSESDIWYIHQETSRRWGKKRNNNPMPEVLIRKVI